MSQLRNSSSAASHPPPRALSPGALRRDVSPKPAQRRQVIETGERLTRTAYEKYAGRPVRVIFHNDSIEPFLVQAMTSPFVSIASHGYLDQQLHGHPRTAGTCSRVLGHYVRERGCRSWTRFER